MFEGLHAGLTERIAGAAIEVHRQLGPGLLESVYESALCCEFADRSLSFERQVAVPLHYKGRHISDHRVDLLVEHNVIVEIKSVHHVEAIHVCQLLTYLRVMHLRVGLLLNFNSVVLKNGIRRVVL